MAGAMPLANLVWQSLELAGDAAFHWWVALSPEIGADPIADPAAAARPNNQGWNDGLIHYDPLYATNGNQQLYVSKRYWVMGNFSRYVRPGDVRHQVHDLPQDMRALAFRSSQGGWVLVGINNAAPGSEPSEVSIQLPAKPGITLTSAIALETSADRDLERVSDPALDANGLLSSTLPAQSVTTVVISG